MDETKIGRHPLVENTPSLSERAMNEIMDWSKEHKKGLESVAMTVGAIASAAAAVGVAGKLMDLAFFGTAKSYAARLEAAALSKPEVTALQKPVPLAPAVEAALKPTSSLTSKEIGALSYTELAERADLESATKVGFFRDRLLTEDFHRPYGTGKMDFSTFRTLNEYSGHAWRSLREVHVPGVNGVRLADDWSVRPIGTKQFDWTGYYAGRRAPLVQQLSASF